MLTLNEKSSKLEKFRKVSGIVWINFEAVITEKTSKEKWTNKKYFNDNYNYYKWRLHQNTEISTFQFWR